MRFASDIRHLIKDAARVYQRSSTRANDRLRATPCNTPTSIPPAVVDAETPITVCIDLKHLSVFLFLAYAKMIR